MKVLRLRNRLFSKTKLFRERQVTWKDLKKYRELSPEQLEKALNDDSINDAIEIAALNRVKAERINNGNGDPKLREYIKKKYKR